jgi:hypothetical protein
MLQLKSLRVGAKLAISAAIGVIIAASMIVIQYRASTVSHALDERARANELVQREAVQTAKATDEIGTQIAGMQAPTQDSVAAIKEIGGTIGRISQIASAIAAAAKGTEQVASNITDVNRGAGETGTASAQVLSSAQSLSGESQHLKIEVEKFLSTVRAA